MAHPDIARLARGVQDCARAITCLADRLDGLERRLDAALPAGLQRSDSDRRALEARIRALEATSSPDQLQGVDQRLRRLETLPTSLTRLRQDVAWLADLATTRRVKEAAETTTPTTAGLEPVYQDLDSLAELVASQQAAAHQSLERVRALERTVLDIRRQLERNPADLIPPSPAPPQGRSGT